MIRVRRASGRRQKFNPRKIYRTCIRAGASEEIAESIVKEIEGKVYDGIPTREILNMVIRGLRERGAGVAATRYDLKHAIMRMGPEGFPFETFMAQILERYGYRAKLRQHLHGLCADQEIDIVLEKGGKRHMVEVKYHNAPGIYTGLKEAMYTYARFVDLKQGHEEGKCEDFNGAWLVTNTRSSLEARRYASCKGIKLLGWRQPSGRGLEKMIEERNLYPVTLIHSVDRKAFTALSRAEIMLVDDLAGHDPIRLSERLNMSRDVTRELVQEATEIVNYDSD
jgi:hypothetical protein